MKAYYNYYINHIDREVTIVSEDDYLINIDFKRQDHDFEFKETDVMIEFKKELDEYFLGNLKEFKTKFKFVGLTDFQTKVLEEVAKVGYGKYISYTDIAKNINNEKACRAVGNAVGKNPLPILVPCHRIIRTDKTIGGYTGGTDIKFRLLEVENIVL